MWNPEENIEGHTSTEVSVEMRLGKVAKNIQSSEIAIMIVCPSRTSSSQKCYSSCYLKATSCCNVFSPQSVEVGTVVWLVTGIRYFLWIVVTRLQNTGRNLCCSTISNLSALVSTKANKTKKKYLRLLHRGKPRKRLIYIKKKKERKKTTTWIENRVNVVDMYSYKFFFVLGWTSWSQGCYHVKKIMKPFGESAVFFV